MKLGSVWAMRFIFFRSELPASSVNGRLCGIPGRHLQHRVPNKDLSDFAPSDVEKSAIISGVQVNTLSTVFECISEEDAQQDPAVSGHGCSPTSLHYQLGRPQMSLP